MRTTIAIDDEILASTKVRARQLNLTLGQVVEDALRRELARDQTPRRGPEVPVFTGGTGPRQGIDLTSNRAVLDALDEGTGLEKLR
jgi:hypothetical protein